MEFGIIDFVLIGLTIIAALIGLKRGIVKQLTSGITFISAIVIAFFTYKYVANYLISSDIFYNINEKFYSLVASKASEEAIKATIETAGEAGVKEVLSAVNIPGFLQGIFTKSLDDMIASNPSMFVGDYVSNAFTTKAIIVGSCILMFVLGLIVVAILVALLRKIADLPGIKVVDRILGMLFTLGKWAVIVCVLLFVVTLFYKVPGFGENVENFMKSQIKFDDDSYMSITKWVYVNNPVLKIISNMSFSELLKSVTGGGSSSEMAIYLETLQKKFIF